MSDSKKKYFEMHTDGIVEDVKYIMDKRSEEGQKEYGTTLEKNPEGFDTWLNELQTELLDAALYIQKIKKLNK
tara:strand:+ start:160 stop:378 length:219 start_codon:yes stop_codon:yes gene_type:complete